MFFGWYVVGGGFLAQLLVVGFFTYAVSLLVVPVREEFGVSLEQVMYSLTVGTFAGLGFHDGAGIRLTQLRQGHGIDGAADHPVSDAGLHPDRSAIRCPW